MNKQNKGITLIALVITIVILVILVGVSVTAAINTGLITNSKKAVADYGKAQTQEELEMDKLAGMLDIYSMEEVKAGEYTGTSNKKYIDPEDSSKVAYIPAGFTVSNVNGESSIDGGLVIYSNVSNSSTITDTAEEYMAKIKSGETGYTVATLQATYNQYVWIPVENPSDMYGTDENGNKLGKLYDFGDSTNEFATSPDQATHLNWYEEIDVTEELQEAQEEYDANLESLIVQWNSLSEEEKTVVSQQYQEQYGITITNEEDIINGYEKLYGPRPTKEELINNQYNSSFREPAYLVDSDDSIYNIDTNGKKIITEDGIKSKFNKMINSVETYKGFYIGRYELTGTVDNPTITKGATPLTADTSYSVNEYLRWYGLYTMCEKLEQNNTDAQGKVTTSMIWGSQWDQAVKKSLENKPDFLTSADTYGWYVKSDYTANGGSGTKNVQVSGLKASAYNIFDMSGNVREWTLEAYTATSREKRGGGCNTSAALCPASDRYGSNSPSGNESNDSCRPQLYL